MVAKTEKPARSKSSQPRKPRKTKSEDIKQTGAKIYIDPKFHFHPKYKEIYQKVKKALEDFPELKEVVLSAFYPKKGDAWETHDVMAIAGIDRMLEFNMYRMPSYNTIYHELYHLVQNQRKSTKRKSQGTFELEATLFGMARLPKSRVETNEMPYLCNVPKSKIIEYGQLAKREKEKGNKNYVKALTDQISIDSAEDEKIKGRSKEWERIGRSMPDPKHSVKFTEKRGSKNYAKNFTYSKVNKYLKANIRKSQQPADNMFKPKTGGYAYEKDDLIKVPNWMK